MRLSSASMRWSLLILFPVGWFASYDLLTDQHMYYTLLTLVVLVATAVILSVLGRNIKWEVHLWIIFLLYLIGYFVKFYVLCYMKVHSQDYSAYLDASYPLETELLNSTQLILSYYETVTVVLVAFSILVTVLMRGRRRVASAVRAPFVRGRWVRIRVQERAIKWLLAVTITVSVLLMYAQVKLGLGFASGAERQLVQLPYRLAGIIMTVNNGLLPLLFLTTLWLADSIRSVSLVRVATAAYLFFGVAAGLVSTSKAVLISVVVSLAVLWLATGSFTRRRGLLLAALVPFIMVFNAFLSVNRVLRSAFPDMGIFEISAMLARQFLSSNSAIQVNDESVEQIAMYLGMLMRINGADSLLNIINFAPSFSFERAWFLLFESPEEVYVLYTSDVLGRLPQSGLAFSPSLLGYFLFVFGNVALVCVGVIVYTLVWHMIFRMIMSARLMIEPILIALLIITLGKFTSEGTLEAMPMAIAIIVAFGVIGECVLRWRFGGTVRRPAYPSSSQATSLKR